MNFSAVILAGGKSSRMGRDKAGLLLAGETLLARQIKLVRAVGATEVFISARSEPDHPEFGGRVLTDNFPARGPLAGMESALRVCRSPLLLVLAVDMPHVKAALLHKLLAPGRGNCGVIPRVGNHLEPLAALYPRASATLAAALLQSTGPSPGARDFAQHCIASGQAISLEFTATEAADFQSWNTPADVVVAGNRNGH